MITAEPYEFEGERFVKLTSELGGTMDVSEAEYAQLGGDTADRPDRPQLAGYVMRDYDHAIATLRESWLRQGVSQREIAEHVKCQRIEVYRWLSGNVEARSRNLFALADALGYDLALIPREGA